MYLHHLMRAYFWGFDDFMEWEDEAESADRQQD